MGDQFVGSNGEKGRRAIDSVGVTALNQHMMGGGGVLGVWSAQAAVLAERWRCGRQGDWKGHKWSQVMDQRRSLAVEERECGMDAKHGPVA